MSNYILYNHTDTPDDFYERLRINIDLNEKFENDYLHGGSDKTVIYSFPMRFIPLDSKRRDIDTGNTQWNKRYLRGLQVILNVIKGPVMTGKEFFEQAFGVDAEEFKAILLMPDEFIRNRVKSNWRKISDRIKRLMPYTREWMHLYNELSAPEKGALVAILNSNKFDDIQYAIGNNTSKRIKKMLKRHVDAEAIVSRFRDGK
jgi:hypothetical protein